MEILCEFRYSLERYPLVYKAPTRWVGVLSYEGNVNSGKSFYTRNFSDLIVLGRLVSSGEVNPINIAVRIPMNERGYTSYYFDPNGDLVKESGYGQDLIPLSKYVYPLK